MALISKEAFKKTEGNASAIYWIMPIRIWTGRILMPTQQRFYPMSRPFTLAINCWKSQTANKCHM